MGSSSWTNFSIRDSSWSASFSNRSWCARLGVLEQVGGDLRGLPLLAHLGDPVQRLHLHQVDHALEGRLGPPGELEDERVGVQAVDHHVDRPAEVRPGAVHLVHEADPGYAVAVGLAPDRLGLRLDARDGVEHGDRTVEHAERPLDLDREVDVSRRVDDVDPVVLPHAGGGRRRDRDAALALLDHPVHLRGALVDLAELVGLARVVEDPLGRGRLARVDMGHDPDVPGPAQRVLADDQALAGLGASLDLLDRVCHVHLLRGDRHRSAPPLVERRAPSEPGRVVLVDHHR